MTDDELTRLLAERVCGWESKHPAFAVDWYEGDDGSFKYEIPDWSPLTELGHASDVIEAMRAAGYRVRMETVNDNEAWFSEFIKWTPSDSRVGFKHIAPSLPRAICIAALRAAGVDE